MPDLEISNLPPLSGPSLSGADVVPLTDVSASETKKITIQDLLSTGIVSAAPLPNGKYVGQLGFDTTNSIIYVWDGGTWLTPALGGASGVTKITAGTNVTISPVGGTGDVTINATGSAALALDDLTDVNVPTPGTGNVLSYNGTQWIDSSAPPADISSSNISQLADVNAAGAAEGDALIYNATASEWQNTATIDGGTF